MPDYDVVVIGGGIGGLATAALCQKAGLKTLVLEQSERIGGCCSTYETEGFHFDVGASVLEMPNAFEELFRRLGLDREKYIPLIPVDPIYDYCDLTRGIRFSYPTSVEGTAEAIAQFAPEDAKTFLKFAKDFTPLISGLVENYFYTPSMSFLDSLKLLIRYPQMLKALPLFVTTHQKVVAKYFKNEDVMASMAFQSFYGGLPPDLCAGLYAIVGLLEHEGIFYPEGGMIRVPAGIQEAFEDLGGETRFNARAVRVIVENRTAKGVELWDGEEISAGCVVGAINAKKLYEDMIGREHLPWHVWRGVQSLVLSMPCPMIYLGVDYEPPLRAHHTQNLTSAEMMNDLWSEHYLKGKMFTIGGRPEVMGLVSWASKIDPSLAPEGKHVLTHMGLAPYNIVGNDWDRYKEQYIDEAVATMERSMIPDLSDHIVYRDMASPKDLERMLLHPGGAVYGIQTDISHMAVFRPANRSKAIKNLYLAGASTHPGGGIPGVLAGGIITGGIIEKDMP
jgi:phytoene desaturase